MIGVMIIATKLHPPPLRARYVKRRRLMVRLDEAPRHLVTALTAPAGFGKSSLLRQWLEDSGLPTTWLSLEAADDNLPRLLAYLIHAFRQIAPGAGAEALALLNSGNQPYASTLLAHLTNDLAAIDDHRTVILDDFHVLTLPEIHDAVEFLIAHLPETIHLIIASREALPLNLARLRGQAQLLEVTAADLRFTAPEVDQFFREVMALDLSSAERTALEMRTEGWVAGLQLAGLSLQSQTDQAAFIAGFGGSDRHVADYLFEEVLAHLPDILQDFLLNTAALDHLCAGLCNAVLDADNSQSMLETLDQRGLFIVPLDHERRWYRYHHLFGELLRGWLTRTHPDRLPLIYLRASAWYESEGRRDEALQYALRAEDWERAADLLEAVLQSEEWVHNGMGLLLRGVEALPEAVVRARPGLELAYAWLLFENFSDEWSRIEGHLRHVEDALDADDPDMASVDLLRANHARFIGDAERVIELCQQAIARLPEDEQYIRSGATVHLAAGYAEQGDLTTADRIYAQGIALCEAAGNLNGLLFAAAQHVALLHRMDQLRRAEVVFLRAMDAASGRTGPDVGMLQVMIGEVFREQNRLDEAEVLLRKGITLCQPFDAWKARNAGWERSVWRDWSQGRANLIKPLGLIEAQKASPYLSNDERAYLDAAAARVDLMQGNFRAARRWSQRVDIPMDAAHGFENLTLARALIASGDGESKPRALDHA